MKSKISGLIDRFFRKEGFNGGNRWMLARVGWLRVYLHHFVYDDWVGDMHDHPGRIISIGLLGKYREETPDGSHIYRAPWLRCLPAAHIHRLVMVDGNSCWTIAIMLKPVRTWGFWTRAGWKPWDEHLKTRTTENQRS